LDIYGAHGDQKGTFLPLLKIGERRKTKSVEPDPRGDASRQGCEGGGGARGSPSTMRESRVEIEKGEAGRRAY